MEPPPLQFVTTRDGVRIAYTDCGEGFPFIRLPFPFNNIQRMWRQVTNLSLYEPLAARFRLIQYDARGIGMSQRGLADSHTFEDYLIDLEAVVERLNLQRFILLGGVLSNDIALRYAALHPDQAAALILLDPSLGSPVGAMVQFEEMATRSWDAFVFTMVQINRRPGEAQQSDSTADYLNDSINQADFLKMIRACSRADSIRDILPSVKSPALVVADGARSTDEMSEFSSLLPDGRMIYTGHPFMADIYTIDGSEPLLVRLIDDFLRDIALEDAPATTGSVLSQREIEVLRLLATGRSNQEIADELVISLNTVRRHVSNILDKTGAKNRAQAAVYARDHGVA